MLVERSLVNRHYIGEDIRISRRVAFVPFESAGAPSFQPRHCTH